MIYGYKKLSRLDDWEEIVGIGKWKEKHSAYELAHKWLGAKGFPPQVRNSFKRSNLPVFQSLSVENLFVEHPTFLGTRKAPSYTDIMVHCRNLDKQLLVLGVEGKVDEPFGDTVCKWIKNGGSSILPTRERRLKFIEEILGLPFHGEPKLRYQLIHRTASVVLEASLYRAVAAVVLVHSFAKHPETDERNWQDFKAFLSVIKAEPTDKNTFTRPINLGPDHNVKTYFIWISDECS